MWTGDDPRESTTGFMLVLGDRIEDAGMIGAKIDEAVCDSSGAMIRNKAFSAKGKTYEHPTEPRKRPTKPCTSCKVPISLQQ